MTVQLPRSIRRLIDLGIERVAPRWIILFGSRARGDARTTSDYDLAFDFPASRRVEWLRFLAELDDEPVTLRVTDIIAWDEAAAELKASIRREGITVYEQSKGIRQFWQGTGEVAGIRGPAAGK